VNNLQIGFLKILLEKNLWFWFYKKIRIEGTSNSSYFKTLEEPMIFNERTEGFIKCHYINI